MKKIILALFIILFCFSVGMAELQEEELSKEDKLKSELYKKEELYFKTLNRDALEKLSKEELISEILVLKELHRLIREEAKHLDELVEMHKEGEKELKGKIKSIIDKAIELGKVRNILELMREASETEEEYDFSSLDKYPDLTKKEEEFSWLDKREEEDRLERIEEENDRLEDLLRELRNKKSELEWDMMRYKSELEWHMLELSSRLEFDLLFNPLLSFPFDYRYTYPSYSKKMDPINYEGLLFTLSTDSKGKMDWTKYGWLKLFLKNK